MCIFLSLTFRLRTTNVKFKKINFALELIDLAAKQSAAIHTHIVYLCMCAIYVIRLANIESVGPYRPKWKHTPRINTFAHITYRLMPATRDYCVMVLMKMLVIVFASDTTTFSTTIWCELNCIRSKAIINQLSYRNWNNWARIVGTIPSANINITHQQTHHMEERI